MPYRRAEADKGKEKPNRNQMHKHEASGLASAK